MLTEPFVVLSVDAFELLEQFSLIGNRDRANVVVVRFALVPYCACVVVSRWDFVNSRRTERYVSVELLLRVVIVVRETGVAGHDGFAADAALARPLA